MKNTINMNSIMGVRIRKQRKLISPINTTKRLKSFWCLQSFKKNPIEMNPSL